MFKFFSIKYSTYARQSNENHRKAQQQVFDIVKFVFSSATYNSAEMLQDLCLIEEFHYFTQALNGDIIHLILFVSFTSFFIITFDWSLIDIYWFRTSPDTAFRWLHNKIDEKSPACNPAFYLVQLYVSKCIKSQLSPNDLDPHMWVIMKILNRR